MLALHPYQAFYIDDAYTCPVTVRAYNSHDDTYLVTNSDMEPTWVRSYTLRDLDPCDYSTVSPSKMTAPEPYEYVINATGDLDLVVESGGHACPMRSENGISCDHPDKPKGLWLTCHGWGKHIPDECPLREKDVLVRLETGPKP